jgi:hypothetical protein
MVPSAGYGAYQQPPPTDLTQVSGNAEQGVCTKTFIPSSFSLNQVY